MKKIVFIFNIFLVFSCDNVEFKSYYPANPPMNIELLHITSGDYTGDYLLLFRSKNNNNSRFGGFLIFADATEAGVVLMKTKIEALDPSLGIAYGESSSLYNPAEGIDTQLAILFTNRGVPTNNILEYNSINYTITKLLQPNPDIVTGNWLTVRSYLWDSANSVILEVSKPGNLVQIQ